MSVLAHKPNHHWYYHPKIGVSGIYGIINNSNSKIYVGSAVNMLHRWHDHQAKLLSGKHCNGHLLSSFRNNPSAFEFIELEKVDHKKELVPREQFWISFYQSSNRKHGYNLAPKAGSCLGCKRTPDVIERHRQQLLGKKMPESMRIKNSERMKALMNSPQGEYRKQRATAGARALKREDRKIEEILHTKRLRGLISKPIKQFDRNGNLIHIHDNIQAAAIHLNLSVSGIQGVLYGIRRLCSGFKFSY